MADKINAYSKHYVKNDECYTPEWAVRLILPHIPKNVKTIWCPFDTDESEFVKVLSSAGYNVIYSHIDYGQDFLEFAPDHGTFHAIISNPPFNGKRQFVERALSFGVPTALLLPATWLNDSAPKIYEGHNLGLVIPDTRMQFKQVEGKAQNKINFKAIFYTSNFDRKIHFATKTKP